MADELKVHGNAVHAFSAAMQNLGLNRQVEQLMAIFRSGHWREFKDGLGTYQFLPGEFDYFLTQWGVDREEVLRFPVDIKVELEAAMDERRTGEVGYRRTLDDARAAVPSRPNPINGFGYTKTEAGAQVRDGSPATPRQREALGATVRRVACGLPARRPSESLPLRERLERSAVRLPDDDLATLLKALNAEQARRHKALKD